MSQNLDDKFVKDFLWNFFCKRFNQTNRKENEKKKREFEIKKV